MEFIFLSWIVALVVPLAVEEVREAARTDVDQLVENGRDHSLGLDLEVKTGLVREPQQLFHHEPSALLENGVNNRVD